MTAIAGVWRFAGHSSAADDCGRMLSAQQFYGPHSSAQWTNQGVALGRQLMRLLPEDAHDRQPLVGGAGRYVLVADIRLDNRDHLIGAMNLPPADARAMSDAAILLAAIEKWGERCVGQLIGDYAFGCWDAAHRRLLLVRDPLGQRPLHYHRSSGLVAFASMPKGLHALADVPYAPDEERIAECLALLPEDGTRTFFRGVERVEPGHVVVITENALTKRLYWQPSVKKISLRNADEYAEALRHHLDEAVHCRLRGVRQVGAHLSGGFDSGAVTATAARQLANSNGQVIAFTAVPRRGYDGVAPRNRFTDEGPYAEATAKLYSNIEHVLIHSDNRSPLADLDRSLFLLDQPVQNICNVGWAYSIADAARDRKLTVMLNGSMGNLGLSYNGLELLPELFNSARFFQLWRHARDLVAKGQMRWRGVLANTLGPWCPASIWVWINRVFNGSTFDIADYSAVNLLRYAELDLPSRARVRNLDMVYRPWKDGAAMRLWALRRDDPGNYNKGVLGGWQIDQRDPTADVRLLEFCLTVPTEQFLSNGVQKALAKRALADRLPRMVLDEPRKGYQAADWHEHLTAVRGLVSAEITRFDSCPPAARALDLPRLHRLVENWPAGGWERDETIATYRLALLRAVSAGHFLRRSTGGNR